MRDDPIVYEDWKIGYSKYFDYRFTRSINLVVSLIISLLNLYIGIIYEISSVVFLWTFSILIVILLEGVLDQMNRSITDRTIFAFGLIGVYFISFPNVDILSDMYSDPSYHLLIGILFALKLILIPVSEAVVRFSENILVPKNKRSEEALHDQVERLKSTQYEIESKVDFDEAVIKLRKSLISPLSVSLSCGIIISVGPLLLGPSFEIIRDFIIVIILLFGGITLSVIIVIDYLEKRRELKSQENQVEQIEVDEGFGEAAK